MGFLRKLGLQLLLASIILIILNTSSVYVYAQGGQEVEILPNQSIYRDSRDNHIHVVGEVKNNGAINAKNVKITVEILNMNSEIIPITTYAQLENIPPGIKAPFEVDTTLDLPQYNGIKRAYPNYDITTESRTWTMLLLSNSSYVDGLGYRHILGEIKNNGTQPSHSTRVVATCYDSDGIVRAVGSMEVNQTVIAAGGDAKFDLLINRIDAPVSRYELQVISNEAILIPEFSSLTIIFTLAYLILLLYMMRCKILFKNMLKF